MTVEILKLYISLISQFFTLSDVAIASSPNNPTSQDCPEFVPAHSNSITTSHFTSRILTDIVDTCTELEGIGGVTSGEKPGSQNDARNALKGLIESCRWRFEEAICSTWSQGELMPICNVETESQSLLYHQMPNCSIIWSRGLWIRRIQQRLRT